MLKPVNILLVEDDEDDDRSSHDEHSDDGDGHHEVYLKALGVHLVEWTNYNKIRKHSEFDPWVTGKILVSRS